MLRFCPTHNLLVCLSRRLRYIFVCWMVSIITRWSSKYLLSFDTRSFCYGRCQNDIAHARAHITFIAHTCTCCDWWLEWERNHKMFGPIIALYWTVESMILHRRLPIWPMSMDEHFLRAANQRPSISWGIQFEWISRGLCIVVLTWKWTIVTCMCVVREEIGDEILILSLFGDVSDEALRLSIVCACVSSSPTPLAAQKLVQFVRLLVGMVDGSVSSLLASTTYDVCFVSTTFDRTCWLRHVKTTHFSKFQ